MKILLDGRIRGDFEDRVEARIWVKPGCWEWLGAELPSGYARFNHRCDDGVWRPRPAHRVIYELFIAPVPTGMVLDHLCRNRRCVNPGHLEPVTNRENILRGTGFAARHARKTRCPRGHEYTEENTYVDRGGMRHCRACDAERHAVKRRGRLG